MAVDPLGRLVSELRTANVASGRVRGAEPAEGDALPTDQWQRFVVLSHLGFGRRIGRAPVRPFVIGVRAYGATPQDAMALYGLVLDELDLAGPRLSAAGVAIYQSLHTDGSADKDPLTQQPLVAGTLEVLAGTDLVTV